MQPERVMRQLVDDHQSIGHNNQITHTLHSNRKRSSY